MSERESIDVGALISAGEGASIEFKASLRCELETGKVNRELTKVVAKTMAGFLNSEGGALLIGIGDDGRVTGIEADIATLSRNDFDGFEQTLRMALGKHLGVEITPSIRVAFLEKDGLTVAWIRCSGWHQPVFFNDGEKREFYVRDGNLTRPLDIRASHEYISHHWPPADVPLDREGLKALLAEVVIDVSSELAGPASSTTELETVSTEDDVVELAQAFAPSPAESPVVRVAGQGGEIPPPWLRVGTRRVLNLFLRQLASSQGWKRLYIISPWISELAEGASLSFDLFLRQLKEDGTTVYLVTRPPEEPWHEAAVARFAETGRANVAFVPDLHVKLYTALTDQGAFAMLGSANFTQQSLINREIGLLVNAYLEGKRVVKDLNYEASQIYRMPGRSMAHKADFRAA